jgi:hypothetical protein
LKKYGWLLKPGEGAYDSSVTVLKTVLFAVVVITLGMNLVSMLVVTLGAKLAVLLVTVLIILLWGAP